VPAYFNYTMEGAHMSENQAENQTETKPKNVAKITSVTIDLDFPIEWEKGEEPVSKIILKRPKGKHLKNLGKDILMFDLLQIASKISGYTPKFFDEMDGVDIMKVTEAVGDFLDGGQKTGETA